jgi:hypothetical protein
LINHTIKLNNNKQLFCSFIDFSKAFDYLVRENIWYKLYQLGLRGRLYNVIKCLYYSCVTSRVRLNNNEGEIFESYLGVRQGESLSPFLFSMYLNDLEDKFYLKG